MLRQNKIITNKSTLRQFIQNSTLATETVLLQGYINQSKSLVNVFQPPKHFSRRHGYLTANICGYLTPKAKYAQFKLNDGLWHKLPQGKPRAPGYLFTIELKEEELLVGKNTLTIEATNKKDQPEITYLTFDYDPTPISLPIKIDWAVNSELESQDGYWETVSINNNWRVRPKPKFEEYDRILNVTGAFAGGRRVETDLIFRNTGWLGWRGVRDYGFGILPLWGGHVDPEEIYPRRGWSFGIAWFYAPRRGLKNQQAPFLEAGFAYKNGGKRNQAVGNSLPFEPKTGIRYFIISECFPEVDSEGKHRCWRQRLKWWAEGESEPEEWIESTDEIITKQGNQNLLPSGEYAVALLTYRTQVDFGSVTVTPL
ncbi:hypothetical protein STA3757_06230 [Stanieria sp. NIES-3757]|nr:hypothetical protein STA3757_06230 [Stanieria sp. NIES-3757]